MVLIAESDSIHALQAETLLDCLAHRDLPKEYTKKPRWRQQLYFRQEDAKGRTINLELLDSPA